MADRRPALDVTIPAQPPALEDLVDALVDDFRPFAIEAGNAESKPRRIHFFTPDDRAAASAALGELLGYAGVVATPVDIVDDGAAWAARSQAGLRAVRIGQLTVAPPWDIPRRTDDMLTIVVRPSMGFGTGHHASTRLCLRALQHQTLRGHAVTDLGTGSVVLAIGAAKMGAATVVAVEQDVDAISNARENIAMNEVESTITLQQDDLVDMTPPRPATIVMANLTGALLCTAAETVAMCAAPDGVLILGGTTIDEVAAVVRAFEPFASVEDQLSEGEWGGLVLTRLPEPTP